MASPGPSRGRSRRPSCSGRRRAAAGSALPRGGPCEAVHRSGAPGACRQRRSDGVAARCRRTFPWLDLLTPPSAGVYSGVATPLTPSTRSPTPVPSLAAKSHNAPSDGSAWPCSTADTKPLDSGIASSDWVMPMARRRSRTRRPTSRAAVDPAPACRRLVILDFPIRGTVASRAAATQCSRRLAPGRAHPEKGPVECFVVWDFRVGSSHPGSSAPLSPSCRPLSRSPTAVGRTSPTDPEPPPPPTLVQAVRSGRQDSPRASVPVLSGCGSSGPGRLRPTRPIRPPRGPSRPGRPWPARPCRRRCRRRPCRR